MKQTCNRLYKSMQEDLELCKGKELHLITEIECCHQIVTEYWHLVRKKVSCYEFPSKEEEIHFFKVLKPKFVSEIIFYQWLTYLETFHPKGEANYQNGLLREKDRFDKFVWSNKDFFEYYKLNESCKDELYFLRPVLSNTENIDLSPYDVDTRTYTTHDYLVAQFMALERYHKFLEEKLKELENKNGH